jgi:hypothetical protein
MSNTKETASLILRTCDITTDDLVTGNIAINNSFGSISADGQTITWKSINPKILFGDMYEKFTKFNLNLASYCCRKSDLTLTDNDITFFISGLLWSNQAYSLKTQSITQSAPLFNLIVGATASHGIDTYGQNHNTLTFFKPISNFDVTIELKNGVNGKMTQVMPHQSFIFDITGVDGYQQNPITNNQELPRNNIDNRLGQLSFR